MMDNIKKMIARWIVRKCQRDIKWHEGKIEALNVIILRYQDMV